MKKTLIIIGMIILFVCSGITSLAQGSCCEILIEHTSNNTIDVIINVEFPFFVYIKMNNILYKPDYIKLKIDDSKILQISINNSNLLKIISKKEGISQFEIIATYNGQTLSQRFSVNTSNSSQSLKYAFDHIVFDYAKNPDTKEQTALVPLKEGKNVDRNNINIYNYNWFKVSVIEDYLNPSPPLKPYAKVKVTIDPSKIITGCESIIGVFDLYVKNTSTVLSRTVVIVKVYKEMKSTYSASNGLMLLNGNSYTPPCPCYKPIVQGGKFYVPIPIIKDLTGMEVTSEDGIYKFTSSNVSLSVPADDKINYAFKTKYQLEYDPETDTYKNCCLTTETLTKPQKLLIDNCGEKFIQAKFLYEAFGGTVTWDRPTNTYKLMFYPGWQE